MAKHNRLFVDAHRGRGDRNSRLFKLNTCERNDQPSRSKSHPEHQRDPEGVAPEQRNEQQREVDPRRHLKRFGHAHQRIVPKSAEEA